MKTLLSLPIHLFSVFLKHYRSASERPIDHCFMAKNVSYKWCSVGNTILYLNRRYSTDTSPVRSQNIQSHSIILYAYPL